MATATESQFLPFIVQRVDADDVEPMSVER
jgi:hypothetical protein